MVAKQPLQLPKKNGWGLGCRAACRIASSQSQHSRRSVVGSARRLSGSLVRLRPSSGSISRGNGDLSRARGNLESWGPCQGRRTGSECFNAHEYAESKTVRFPTGPLPIIGAGAHTWHTGSSHFRQTRASRRTDSKSAFPESAGNLVGTMGSAFDSLRGRQCSFPISLAGFPPTDPAIPTA